MNALATPSGTAAIAIVGMAGRFPGARDLGHFWRNLRDGVESITRFSDDELAASGVPPHLVNDSSYVRARGILEDAALFDAPFFNFSPREAALTDPQHRMLLECAWEGLESAGYDPAAYGGRIGVYVGAGSHSYLLANVMPGMARSSAAVEDLDVQLATYGDYLATRISYKLNLRGPSIDVQTACSTSLVAVHLACSSLRTRECDMALAGGATVLLPEKAGYLYEPDGIESPDGHCRAFDARAQGTVFGSGAGIVVLKRLDDALRDGDHVHAVIRGSSINNDGAIKVGYLAPSIEGQRQAIEDALAAAGVGADTIGYVEAHGTATALGDPVEIAALTRAFRATTDKTAFCAIGSVKTNIGHTVAASGVAGLIKTVLALKHGRLPPSLHFDAPNPSIDFASTPFYVNTALAEWTPGASPRRAGVSSFGVGGTNAHVVLEEAPEAPAASAATWSRHLVTLSARTNLSLEAATSNLSAHLGELPELSLADVAYTLQVGRRSFAHRRVVVARDAADAAQALRAGDSERVFSGVATPGQQVAFLFPGQGTQYVGMGRELYRTEPTFRPCVDRCCAQLERTLGTDLRELLYPPENGVVDRGSPLDQTRFAQPALFVIEYALASLLASWGVRPHAMLGHSIGEYVAACLAGVFSLEEALTLVAARGRLIQELPPGAMLAVALSADAVSPLLGSLLSIAAVNGPSMCTVSGPAEAIEELAQLLAGRQVAAAYLRTSHAFHSSMMDPARDVFRHAVEAVRLRRPAIPFASNVTGAWITDEEATNPEYWVRHLRQTVRFADGLGVLMAGSPCSLLEVGPGRTLTGLARQHPAMTAERGLLATLSGPRGPDDGALLETVGRLWMAGVPVVWPALHDGPRRRVTLPTYPFERQRHWIEPPAKGPAADVATPGLGKHGTPAEWLYVPTWKRAQLPRPVLPSAQGGGPPAWLLLVGPHPLASALADQIVKRGDAVVRVQPGERFARLGPGKYVVHPRRSSDYAAVLEDLARGGQRVTVVVHAWTLAPNEVHTATAAGRVAEEAIAFHSLIALAQALGRRGADADPVRIQVLATGLHEVTGDEPLSPLRATLLGPCKVIPQEYPTLSCRIVDVVLPEPGSPREAALVDHLVGELVSGGSDPVVAYRGSHRWVQDFEPLARPVAQTILRAGGTYLLTGGFGRIGALLAEHLARTVRARLILVGRLSLPDRAAWSAWLNSHSDTDPVSRRVRQVERLEALGAEVEVASVDVADAAGLADAVRKAEARFGRIDGLIHAAGVVEESTFLAIDDMDPSAGESHFRAKVEGVLALDQVLGERPLDFWLLTSSLATVVGGAGFAAYTAANAFMDTFAYARRRRSPVPCIAVNWDSWQVGDGTGHASLAPLALTPDEGLATFELVLSSPDVTQVVVSTAALADRLEHALPSRPHRPPVVPTEPIPSAEPIPPERNLRPDSPERAREPQTEMERMIAGVWQELLGVPQVVVRDNFFDLGGHSLLAIKLIHRLEKATGVRVDPAELMFHTLGQLASAVEGRMPSRSSGRTRGTSRLLSTVRSLVQGFAPRGGTPQ